MERKSVVGIAVALALSAGVAAAQEAGPYNLPSLEKVKAQIKPTDDEAKRLSEIYAQAAKNEAESKARAKENGTDRKTLEGYLSIGKGETINRIKEALDKEKGAAFDKLVAAQPPPDAKKKKK
jgi:hypothetical protein